MDFSDLIHLNHMDKTIFEKPRIKINKTVKKKGIICLNCLDLKLIILCSILISNLYIIYLLKSIFNSNQVTSKSFLHKDSKSDKIFSSDKNSEEERIIKESFIMQKDFCNNQNKYLNQEFENMITLTNFSFLNVDFQMYVYKSGDNYMSNGIIKSKKYDAYEIPFICNALELYANIKNIQNKKDIFILDLGANLGVYPSFFGRKGYTVISFEASPRNYYILKKNYCKINRNNENIFIINRGLGNQEKICNYYTQIGGIGNGMIKCDENKEEFDNDGFHWKKSFEVPITKLSRFIPYLADKNLAFIKLDIEGSEGVVMQDAIELITKYHVPYVLAEYSKAMINEHGTNPVDFIKIFTDNGYKVSYNGFLSQNFLNPEAVKPANIYFTYYGNK